MNAILGFTDLVLGEIKDERHRRHLAAIESSGRTLLRIINDILDLSKIEAGKLELQNEAANPHIIFREISQIFSQTALSKGIDLEFHIDPSIPEDVLLDEIRLRQILFNLVGNAVKFTDQGFVRLAVEKRNMDRKNKTFELIITVEDNGIGIPKNQQDLIFDTFKQQDGQQNAKYGGTGLGLTITKRLVEMMGGRISVESIPGKGSVFRVVLANIQVSTQKKAARESGYADWKTIVFDPAVILIVDDIEYNRELLNGYLESYPFTIVTAKSGREAIEKARLHRPNLILMDMKLPDIDGYAATRTIKADETLQACPVVAITAFAMLEDKSRIKNSGCDGFLAKPIQKGNLIREIAGYLPHTVQDSEKMEAEIFSGDYRISAADLSPEARLTLPELLETLQRDFMGPWNGIREAFIFQDMEAFAQNIISLGKGYAVGTLEQWGCRLKNQAEQFDMENLPGTVDAFPKILESISSIVQERD